MDHGGIDPGVLHPHREVRRTGAAAGDAADASREQLEVGVPDPRHVAAVGDVVVQHPQQVVAAGLEGQRAQHLVRARRVLDEQDPQLPRPGAGGGSVAGGRGGEGEALRPSEGRAHVGQPGGDRLDGDPERARKGGRREGVVDVVEAGEVERHARLTGGRAKRELRRADAVQEDLAGGERRGRAALAATVAVVVAEVAEVHGVEHVGGPATAAVLGVGGVGHAGHRQRVVLHAEVQRLWVVATEVGDQRVVGVQDRAGGTGRQHLLPALGDPLELAVAVELVAEQVRQQHRPGGELTGDGGEPELVDLEQPELAGDAAAGVGSVEERRGHATGHVRAGVIVDQLRPRRGAGSRPPSRRWSSCRWLPRSGRCRAAGGSRASGSRRVGGASGPSPVRWWRRRRASGRSSPRSWRGRAWRRGRPPSTALRGALLTAGRRRLGEAPGGGLPPGAPASVSPPGAPARGPAASRSGPRRRTCQRPAHS